MKEHLLKYLPARGSDSYVLVLYDGHRSHFTITLIECAIQNYIILFVLPPHCSHLLQPLDVSCFGQFEIAWNSACHSFLRSLQDWPLQDMMSAALHVKYTSQH